MNIDSITQKRFEDKLTECLAILNKRYNKTFTTPVLRFRQMGKKAGVAYYRTRVIELNSDYCHNGSLDKMINQTLPHELAHIISFELYGLNGCGHKLGWKRVMRVMDVPPIRCHAYSIVGVKIRRRNTQQYHYTCNCKSHMVSATIHNRIVRGSQYTCRHCRTIIKFNNSNSLLTNIEKCV